MVKIEKINENKIEKELKNSDIDGIPEDILWEIKDKYPDDIIADLKFYKEIINDIGLNNPHDYLLQRTVQAGNEIFSVKWKGHKSLVIRFKKGHSIL